MNKKAKIKILIVTHKPSDFPKGQYFVPMHAGRDVARARSKDGKISKSDYNWLLKNTIGDNTGDNISAKNRYYCEMSSLYWAWKNYDELDNPDYIGLMHYRRHFVFDDEYYKEREKKESHRDQGLCVINERFMDDDYAKRIGLNDKNIEDACNTYDAIVSYPTKLKLAYNNKDYTIRTNYVHQIPGMKEKDFDLMFAIIKNKYPDYIEEIDKYANSDSRYIFHMFIMKKELFFEYCEFLFGVLFDVEKQVNFEDYTVNGKRSLGYLGEIMLSIFFIIKGNCNLKIKNCGIDCVQCVTKKELYIFKLKNIIQNVFSIKNEKNHKVIKLLGIKVKIKKGKKHA